MLFDLPTNEKAISIETAKSDCRIYSAQSKVASAFGTIEQGKDYPFASGSLWSTHDILRYILGFAGPCSLTMATWSIATAAADLLVDWKRSGLLNSVAMLVDWRVQVRTPGVLTLAKEHFTDIRVTCCHAKAFVMQNDTWNISLIGSANLTNNPRIECGHLSTSKTVADFHKSWILAEIANAKPFGLDMRKAKPDGRA
jgi:hypothetical protein